MISSIDQYDDIQKIQSFIIIINSQNKKQTGSQNQQKQKMNQKLAEKIESQKYLKDESNRRILEGFSRNQNVSIADLAIKKIQYRTRLHENVQKYAQMKEKCKNLINHSPIKEKYSSQGFKKLKKSVHKSQLKLLNYHSKKTCMKPDIKKSQKLQLNQSNLVINFPQLKVNPFLLTIKNNNFCQDFYLLKTLKQKLNENMYLAQQQLNYNRCTANNTLYNLRIIRKSSISLLQRQNLIKQLKIQSFFNHINFIKIISITYDQNFLYILYQCIFSVNLYDKIKQVGIFFQREARRIIKQVCSGIQYLQEHGVCHQNITSQSIYFQEGIVKIGQFQQSECKKNIKLHSKSKSHHILNAESQVMMNYDQQLDIWNIGILTYELLYGRIPIQLKLSLNKNKFKKQQIHFFEDVDISNTAKEFIIFCLQKNYVRKRSIKDVIDHGFLKGGQKYRWTTV